MEQPTEDFYRIQKLPPYVFAEVNAMKAEDPKAVFQAMRPVFSELLSRTPRSTRR
jgi:hypothetical protein